MSKRLLLLGNSHVAAPRDALTRYAERLGGAEIMCIGAHKMRLVETSCENNILRPVSDGAKESFANFGGVSEVDLSEFDAVVIVGCGFAVSRAGFLYRKARWASLPSLRAMKEHDSAAWELVSEAAFCAMLQHSLLDALGGRLLRILRRGTDVPVLLASQPRCSTALLEMEQHALMVLKYAIGNRDAAMLSAMFDETAALVCSAFNATFLPQPRQTVQDHVLTKPTFTRGAVRLSKEGRYAQPEDDILHANAAYGAALLEQVLKQA